MLIRPHHVSHARFRRRDVSPFPISVLLGTGIVLSGHMSLLLPQVVERTLVRSTFSSLRCQFWKLMKANKTMPDLGFTWVSLNCHNGVPQSARLPHQNGSSHRSGGCKSKSKLSSSQLLLGDSEQRESLFHGSLLVATGNPCSS